MDVATAVTAGLLANFLTINNDPVASRKQLYDLKWPRVKGGRDVLWNGLDSRKPDAEAAALDPVPSGV